MNVSLPSPLASAIAQLLEGVSRNALAVRAEALSKAYRSGGTSRGVTGDDDVLAYLVARLPATFAAVSAVFARVKEALPEFVPASLLDAGAGTGAASWAAAEAWSSLADITMLDGNANFLKTAKRLAEASERLSLSRFVAGDLNNTALLSKADVVVASYVLAELPENRAGKLALDLWNASAKMLVLVEPGTPAGFARILAARKALIALGAHIAAPCTHQAPCPMQGKNWCHFSQRLPRSRDHMIAKSANVPFEDERYAYLAVTREPVARHAAFRIIAPPESAKAGVTLTLCGENGLRRETTARREKEKFATARKLDWGDAI